MQVAELLLALRQPRRAGFSDPFSPIYLERACPVGSTLGPLYPEPSFPKKVHWGACLRLLPWGAGSLSPPLSAAH